MRNLDSHQQSKDTNNDTSRSSYAGTGRGCPDSISCQLAVPIGRRYPQPGLGATNSCETLCDHNTTQFRDLRISEATAQQSAARQAAAVARAAPGAATVSRFSESASTVNSDGHDESDWSVRSLRHRESQLSRKAVDWTVTVATTQRHDEQPFRTVHSSPPQQSHRGEGGVARGGGEPNVSMRSGDGSNVPAQHSRHCQQQQQQQQRVEQGRDAHSVTTARVAPGNGYESAAMKWRNEQSCVHDIAAPSGSATRVMRFDGSVQQQPRRQPQHEQWQSQQEQRQQQQQRVDHRRDSMRTSGATFRVGGHVDHMNTSVSDRGFPPRGLVGGNAPTEAYSPNADFVTRTPSPGSSVVPYMRGAQRPSTASPNPLFAHARSLSEGHDDNKLIASADVAQTLPLSVHRQRQSMQGPHFHGHSEGTFIVGTRQSVCDSGNGCGGGGGGRSDSDVGYISAAHAGSPGRSRQDAMRPASSHAAIAANARHGYNVARHPVMRRQLEGQFDRFSYRGSFFDGADAPFVGPLDRSSYRSFSESYAVPKQHPAFTSRSVTHGDRDSPSPPAVITAALASEHQQQQQQHHQLHHFVPVSVAGIPPGFAITEARSHASPERHRSSAVPGNFGGGSQTAMASIEFSTQGRSASSEISMDYVVDRADRAAGSAQHIQGAAAATAAVVQRGRAGGGGLPSGVVGNTASSPFLRKPTSPNPQPSAPQNPVEWLQRLQRARKSTTTAITKDPVSGSTSPTSCMSSLSSLAPSPTSRALATAAASTGAITVGGSSCVVSVAEVGDAAAAVRVSPNAFARTCPAPDCPGTENCLPGATPNMVVYEVKFKRATRRFLPGEGFSADCGGRGRGHGGVLCIGDRVKVITVLDCTCFCRGFTLSCGILNVSGERTHKSLCFFVMSRTSFRCSHLV